MFSLIQNQLKSRTNPSYWQHSLQIKKNEWRQKRYKDKLKIFPAGWIPPLLLRNTRGMLIQFVELHHCYTEKNEEKNISQLIKHQSSFHMCTESKLDLIYLMLANTLIILCHPWLLKYKTFFFNISPKRKWWWAEDILTLKECWTFLVKMCVALHSKIAQKKALYSKMTQNNALLSKMAQEKNNIIPKWHMKKALHSRMAQEETPLFQNGTERRPSIPKWHLK